MFQHYANKKLGKKDPDKEPTYTALRFRRNGLVDIDLAEIITLNQALASAYPEEGGLRIPETTPFRVAAVGVIPPPAPTTRVYLLDDQGEFGPFLQVLTDTDGSVAEILYFQEVFEDEPPEQNETGWWKAWLDPDLGRFYATELDVPGFGSGYKKPVAEPLVIREEFFISDASAAQNPDAPTHFTESQEIAVFSRQLEGSGIDEIVLLQVEEQARVNTYFGYKISKDSLTVI